MPSPSWARVRPYPSLPHLDRRRFRVLFRFCYGLELLPLDVLSDLCEPATAFANGLPSKSRSTQSLERNRSDLSDAARLPLRTDVFSSAERQGHPASRHPRRISPSWLPA